MKMSSSFSLPPSSSTPRMIAPGRPASPRSPISSTFVQPTITPVASTDTLPVSSSAREEYFLAKARELEMRIAILAVQKEKEETKIQGEMLKINLEERKLLVKQRQM
jgi:hypothetical protein